MNSMILIKENIKTSLHDSWGWITALGVIMIIFGAFIMAGPLQLFTASLTVEVLIAVGFVVSGGLQFAHAMHEAKLRRRIWYVLGGVFYAVGGLFLAFHPAAGLVSLVFLVAIVMLADGVSMAAFGLGLKGQKGRAWVIASGAASIVVGIILFTGLPNTAMWALGLFVGFAFLVEGVSFTMLGIEARRFVVEVNES
jgi:uncharacterized membrane protein HdeD (DUF308 family)